MADHASRILETVPVQIWTALPDGNLDYVTEQTAQYFGLTSKQLLEDGWQNVVHADDLPHAVECWVHSLKTGEPYEVEFRLHLATGEYAWHLARAVAQRNEAGEIVRWFGTNTNIEAQREQQSQMMELHRSLERARADLSIVLEQAPVAIALVRGEKCIIEIANTTICQMWQHPASEVIGRPLFEVLSHASGKGFEELIAQVLATGKPYGKNEHQSLGSNRFVSFVYQPMFRESSERADSVLIVATDVTENVAARKVVEVARQEAETAIQAMDLFLATISHELRTPLNAILGWARLLNRGQVSEADRPKALGAIERNALSQTHLIGDLLDVSRIISGKMRLDVGPMELAEVVRAAIDVVTPAANAKNVRIEARYEATTNYVIGDASRLQQVVWNLLSNAVKFTPKGGSVDIRIANRESVVEIVITDTGMGIAPEFLPYVFDRFRQADSASSRAHGGLGLGLAIAKTIVELHGGSISVKSEGLGRGATFSFVLPIPLVRQTPVTPNPEPSLKTDAPAIEPAKDLAALVDLEVLVVDDEQDGRELLVATLRQSGAKVTSVGSAAHALEAIRNGKFEMMISDIGMPNEDGYSLLKKVRALSPTHAVLPAIALTAYARTEDRARALAAGFNAYLAKPVEASELFATMARLRTPI